MQLNKVAIVTGASRGIGAASAKLLAEHGFKVCINYLKNEKAAIEVQKSIQESGGECITHQADVSNAEAVSYLFKRVNDELGKVSVLVNNAGILKTQCSFHEISEQRFDEVFKTNVMSCFLCSKEAIKYMSKKHGGVGGAIVNVSSGAAKSGSPHEYIDYAVSKGAIDTLTRGLALELAEDGVRVNGVRPGFIYTDMHASGGEPGRVDRLKSKIPLKRGGLPREVAEAIVWLATDKSSYVTGSIIDVAGGV